MTLVVFVVVFWLCFATQHNSMKAYAFRNRITDSDLILHVSMYNQICAVVKQLLQFGVLVPCWQYARKWPFKVHVQCLCALTFILILF